MQVCLLHDNARPHIASATRQQLEELGWARLDYGTTPTILPRLGVFRLALLPLSQELLARLQLPKLRLPKIWIGWVLRALACGLLEARHTGSVRTL